MLQHVMNTDWSLNVKFITDLKTEVSDENEASEMCKNFFDFTEPTYNSPRYKQEDPKEIILSYFDDLDLPLIHKIFRDKIIIILSNVQTADEKIYKLDFKKNTHSTSPVEQFTLMKEIDKLENFKKKHHGSNLWSIYKKNAIPILNIYVKLMKDSTDKFYNTENILDDDSKKEERLKCIEKYISILHDIGIINIKATFNPIKRINCPVCSMGSVDSDFSSCNCGFKDGNIKHVTEYVDLTKSIGSNLISMNIKPFQSWIERLTCISKDVYPQDDMFDKFDRVCFEKNIVSRYDAFNNNLDPPITNIISLLKNTNYSEYYIIKHQIRKDYYGHRPYVVSDIQANAATSLYVEFQNKYKISGSKKTSINIEILGYVFLSIVGVKLYGCDFKMPSSSETISYAYKKLNEILTSMGIDTESIPDIRVFSK